MVGQGPTTRPTRSSNQVMDRGRGDELRSFPIESQARSVETPSGRQVELEEVLGPRRGL